MRLYTCGVTTHAGRRSFPFSKSQFRRRASAVPNLIQLGSTVARQKYDCDSDVVPESYQIQDLLYWSHMTVSQQLAIQPNWRGFQNWSKNACS